MPLTFAAKPPSSSLSARLAGQKRKKTLFDDPDSDAEDAAPSASSVSTFGGLSKSNSIPSYRTSSPPKKSPKLAPRTESTTAVNLSSLHSSRKHAEESASLDPSIYDYDTFYETSKTTDPSTKNSKDNGDRSSRYITSLLESKRVRERDALRAEEKKLAREREEEGDEYADKEKFVTSAYKAAQEERRRAEAEEAERERQEEEERKKNGGGMKGFYKDRLKKEEDRRKAIEQAEQDIKERLQRGETASEQPPDDDGGGQVPGEKSDREKARALNASGANVILNDEGAVVDKRQLLSAGLNVAPPNKSSQNPSSTKSSNPSSAPASSRARPTGPTSSRLAQASRQTAQIEEQILQRQREIEEREEQERREMEEKMRSKKTEGEVQGARERALARKREREAEAERRKKGE